jgi:hypothetical protein
MVSGIYKITHKDSGKLYIGSAQNISIRWGFHKRALRKKKHHSPLLQRSWDKYGEDAFEFSVIVWCERDQLLKVEQHYIDLYQSYEPLRGFNICRFAGSQKKHGMERTKEYKAWQGAKSRCYRKSNQDYKYCGARGIIMCGSWVNDFQNFYDDMGDCPPGCSLGRIDTSKDYCKNNCAWMTQDQLSQTRKSIKFIIVDGKRLTTAAACRQTGVSNGALVKQCLEFGVSRDEAIINLVSRPKFGVAGQKFGRLTLVSEEGKGKNGLTQWLFKCDCGSDKISALSHVKRGMVKSCGCLLTEFATNHMTQMNLNRKKR